MRVRSGDIGNRTFRRHSGLHPSGETVGNRYTCRLIEFTVQINSFVRESPVAGEA
jgi:hypothetical protein